jgi:Fe2+ transport system protein FeoA
MIPLSRLARGQCAEVCRIEGPVDDVHRLEELGLCPGARFRMFQPGNPCILRMDGGKFCLRACNGLKVLVKRHNGKAS